MPYIQKIKEKARTILIIDDEETMHDSCCQILEQQGYMIKSAFDGTNGMSLVREEQPDMVLLDIKLPQRNGLDVLKEIIATDPDIVTVIITGYATIESAVDAMKYGASDFLPKPFTPDELRMIIRRGMEKRELLFETRRLQEENTRIRENFVSIITHEMQSPLVAVEQYIEVFLGGYTGELQSKQLEILAKCKQRIKWLLSLVNEWLVMSRIRDKIIIEKLEKVNICNVLYEAIDLVNIQAEKKNISLHFNIPKDFPVVMGNHELLVHLFMNLYSNAIKYNNKFGKIITRATDEKDSISIQVCDTGIGIPQEILPLIFDEFYRVCTIRKKTKKIASETGTGLGLAIVKKIVDAHKGYINVDSQENIGTCFAVHLPKKHSQSSQKKYSIIRDE